RIVIVRQREYENVYVWMRRKDAACCLDAIDARHIKIHEDDVGLERGCQGDGFVPSHRLTNYLGGWLCLQQRTQPVAKDGVIIGNQDANAIHDESPCAHLRCHAPDGSGSTTHTVILAPGAAAHTSYLQTFHLCITIRKGVTPGAIMAVGRIHGCRRRS